MTSPEIGVTVLEFDFRVGGACRLPAMSAAARLARSRNLTPGYRETPNVAFDAVLADRVRLALANKGAVREVKMFGGLTFMLNGQMCCGVAGRDLIVRLGRQSATEAIQMQAAHPFAPTGKPVRGMAAVLDAGKLDQAALDAWIEPAIAFTALRPPK